MDTGDQLTVQGGQHHTYLLMSHPASSETKVLETGEELAEVPVDSSGFILQYPTIAAGNVLNNTLIVQASSLLGPHSSHPNAPLLFCLVSCSLHL